MTSPKLPNAEDAPGARASAIGPAQLYGGWHRPRFSHHPRPLVFRSTPNRVIELSLSFDFDFADSRVFTRGSDSYIPKKSPSSDFGSNRAVIRSSLI